MKNRTQNFVLAAVSLLAAIALAELGARIVHRQFALKSFLGEQRNFLLSAYPAEFHETLGWQPETGPGGTENTWGTAVTIVDGNIRSNGPESLPLSQGAVLVVGDSFTFGDQVSDDETWAAYLEHELSRPVINGGVFGYGIDQCYLRARELVERYRPEVLVFSFIPDDINRCELSKRYGIAKPYFTVKGRDLVLENTPVPQPTHETPRGRLREVVGYGYLAHLVMMRVAPDFWLRGNRWESERAHGRGLEVACRLLGRLQSIADEWGVKQVIVLVQYQKRARRHDYPMVNRVLECVDGSRITVVDLRDALARERDAGRIDNLFDAHMTPAGNAFVARQLADVISLED